MNNDESVLRLKYEVTNNCLFNTPNALLFELFLPWIHKTSFAYQEQEETETENYSPEGIRYSKSYYIKKFR